MSVQRNIKVMVNALRFLYKKKQSFPLSIHLGDDVFKDIIDDQGILDLSKLLSKRDVFSFDLKFKQSLEECFFIALDVDSPDFPHTLSKPNMIVNHGNKFFYYWLLDDSIDRDQYKEILFFLRTLFMIDDVRVVDDWIDFPGCMNWSLERPSISSVFMSGDYLFKPDFNGYKCVGLKKVRTSNLDDSAADINGMGNRFERVDSGFDGGKQAQVSRSYGGLKKRGLSDDEKDQYYKELFKSASLFPIINLFNELNCSYKKVSGGMRTNFCPNCGDASDKSVKVTIDEGKNVWNCFACDEGGSSIQFYMLNKGCSALDAAKALADGAIKISDYDSSARDERIRIEDARLDMLNRLKVKLLKNLFNKSRFSVKKDVQGCLSYLVDGRGISKEVLVEAWRRELIAFLPDSSYRANEFIQTYFEESELKKAGLLKEGKKMPGICFYPILFPFRDEYGEISSVEFRMAKEAEDGRIKSFRHGKGSHFWIWKGIDNSVVGICEGVIDALSAIELGFPGDVYCIAGISALPQESDKIFAGKDVIFMFDNDENQRGQDMARQYIMRLEKVAKSVESVTPDKEGMDLNKIVQTQGVQE